mmetsp:Transcript_41398/g.63108  ORF Transcript_41398/g.63108 Transcript_41398/m.63108 type:complete len:135 (+) Transcript_41398:3160-3564(+)
MMSSVLSVLYLAKILEHEVDPIFTNVCQDILHISDEDIEFSKHGFFYLTDFGHFYSYQILISCNVFVFAIYTIMQLKRTQQFGYVVIMITEVIKEVIRFFMAFGIVIFAFFAILRVLIHTLKHNHFDLYDSTFD